MRNSNPLYIISAASANSTPRASSDFATRDVEVGQLIFNRSEKVTIEAEDATRGWWDKSMLISAAKSIE
jgi:hypothetical protein